MEAFTTLDAVVVPLDRANVDTDAIIPKRPAIAAATAIAGLTRWLRPPAPCRPSKLRLEVDAQRKHRLLKGLDAIGLTLKKADAIRAYEARRRVLEPWLFA